MRKNQIKADLAVFKDTILELEAMKNHYLELQKENAALTEYIENLKFALNNKTAIYELTVSSYILFALIFSSIGYIAAILILK